MLVDAIGVEIKPGNIVIDGTFNAMLVTAINLTTITAINHQGRVLSFAPNKLINLPKHPKAKELKSKFKHLVTSDIPTALSGLFGLVVIQDKNSKKVYLHCICPAKYTINALADSQEKLMKKYDCNYWNLLPVYKRKTKLPLNSMGRKYVSSIKFYGILGDWILTPDQANELGFTGNYQDGQLIAEYENMLYATTGLFKIGIDLDYHMLGKKNLPEVLGGPKVKGR